MAASGGSFELTPWKAGWAAKPFEEEIWTDGSSVEMLDDGEENGEWYEWPLGAVSREALIEVARTLPEELSPTLLIEDMLAGTGLREQVL